MSGALVTCGVNSYLIAANRRGHTLDVVRKLGGWIFSCLTLLFLVCSDTCAVIVVRQCVMFLNFYYNILFKFCVAKLLVVVIYG